MLRYDIHDLLKLPKMFSKRLLGSLAVLEGLSVYDRHRGLIGKHPQPSKFLLWDDLSAEKRQRSQSLSTEDQRVSGEGTNPFASRPIRPDYPLTLRCQIVDED